MNTIVKRFLLLVISGLFIHQAAFGDGLLVPADDENYPFPLLKNKSCEVSVTIHGAFIKTAVYQEFLNESGEAIDATYAFPLPAEAKAVNMFYWRNDTVFRAILKEQSQSTTPGTGEGGLAAKINEYIGGNGITLDLLGIPANSIQKVEIHYISMARIIDGNYTCSIPLECTDFVKHPLDYFKIHIDLSASSEILDFNLTGIPEISEMKIDSAHFIYDGMDSKHYPSSDISLEYNIDKPEIGINWYAEKNSDTTDGHFGLTVMGPDHTESTLSNRILFLLSNSTTMLGNKLDQSILGIQEALDQLGPDDYFNIIVFNVDVQAWKSSPVVASAGNVTDAIDFLNSVETNWGSSLEEALVESLNQVPDNQYNNVIITFTDGVSAIDPSNISSLNDYNTGIHFVAIGEDIERSRLELVSGDNYGTVTYLDINDNIRQTINNVYSSLTQPVLKDLDIQFQSIPVFSVNPNSYPTLNAGSEVTITGRYHESGSGTVVISGFGDAGPKTLDFPVDFPGADSTRAFISYFWAKEIIEQLEYEILVYDLEEELKDSLTELSLMYNIRCRYTSFVADYSTVVRPDDDSRPIGFDPGVEYAVNVHQEQAVRFGSILESCFPNPFYESTSLRIFIHSQDLNKNIILSVYNLSGKLIGYLDLSGLDEGWHTIVLNLDELSDGHAISGIYFARLVVNKTMTGTIRLNYLK